MTVLSALPRTRTSLTRAWRCEQLQPRGWVRRRRLRTRSGICRVNHRLIQALALCPTPTALRRVQYEDGTEQRTGCQFLILRPCRMIQPCHVPRPGLLPPAG